MLNIIAIHGVPRSGTTWLGELFNSSKNTLYKYQPLFSYIFKDFLTQSSTKEDMDQFFSSLATSSDDFLDQRKERLNGNLPIFEKSEFTHLVYKEVRYHNILYNLLRKCDDINLMLIIRSPLSVISSWINAPKEFRADLGWIPIEEWRYALKKNLNKPEEYNGYERWKEATRYFINLSNNFPDKAIIVEYRSLLESTEKEVRRLFKFCNLKYGDQTIKFVHDSKSFNNSNKYSVFRKKQNDEKWRDDLDSRISAEIIDDLKGTDLERYLYL